MRFAQSLPCSPSLGGRLQNSLDFLEAGQPEDYRQDPFLLKSAMPQAGRRFAHCVGVGVLEDRLAKRIGDLQDFEKRHAASISATVAIGADFYFDGVPLGIDSLVRRGRDEGLVKFLDAIGRQPQFCQKLGSRLEPLFAFGAEPT
jgi:hypothetical protein